MRLINNSLIAADDLSSLDALSTDDSSLLLAFLAASSVIALAGHSFSGLYTHFAAQMESLA